LHDVVEFFSKVVGYMRTVIVFIIVYFENVIGVFCKHVTVTEAVSI